MKTLIFTGDAQMYTGLRDAIVSDRKNGGKIALVRHAANYDTLCRMMSAGGWDLIFVAEAGARGMEVCIGVRKMLPKVPLVWFSDDPLFAAQSYRLNCTYFAPLPATGQQIAKAMDRVLEQNPGCYAWG